MRTAYLCAVTFIVATGMAVAQREPLQLEQVPADIPADVREQILLLYSDERGVASSAIEALWEMGERAAPA
jgi:hypothetical protein